MLNFVRSFLKFALLSVLLVACHSEEKPFHPPKVSVTAVQPLIQDIAVTITSLGKLSPSLSVDVHPQVNGVVDRIFVDEGEFVDLEAPIISIESTLYKIKVDEASAQLAMEQASLYTLERKLERFQALAKKDFISQVEWEDLETQLLKAQSSVKLAMARLNAAKVDLDHCIIRSPIQGRIGRSDLHRGLFVTAGQQTPLLTVTNTDALTVEFSLTEKDYGQVQAWEKPFFIESLSDPKQRMEGKITFIDNEFDPETGLLLVKGRVENGSSLFKPGQHVRVRILASMLSAAIVIPQKAIRYNEEGPYVFVIQEDQTALITQLQLGKEEGVNQIITQGLRGEEKVVLDGHFRLASGSKVEVKE